MRIIQIVSGVNFGDAIGNHVVEIKKRLQSWNYATEIISVHLDKRLPSDTIKPLSWIKNITEQDIILYHMASKTPLNRQILELPGKKIMMYHNITPPSFFAEFDYQRVLAHREALQDLTDMKTGIDCCIAMSEFNRKDLILAGYDSDKIKVMPAYFIPFEDYAQQADIATIEKYADEWTNILFVGRFAPNKKHEDIIRAFAYYSKHINKKSRLIFVGSAAIPEYRKSMELYAQQLGVNNVIFTGHISFSEIIAYYKVADIFLCMSEHEGFCVPLAEAMYFHVPIIAYASCAIPDTLGNAGVLLDTKDPVFTAMCIDKVLTKPGVRESIIEKQNERLKDFEQETVAKWLLEYFQSLTF